jgi:hypothetical protein
LPSAAAVAEAVAPQLAFTVTFSLASAQPQTAFFVCCCRTMWSLNSLVIRTSADADVQAYIVAKRVMIRFMSVCFIRI